MWIERTEFGVEYDELFAMLRSCDYLVEATREEQCHLWAKYAKNNMTQYLFQDKNLNTLDWKDNSRGYLCTIGHINDDGHEWPVNLCFSISMIEGCQVVFWEIVSDLCWYSKAEVFLAKFCCARKRTNSSNFFNIVCDMNSRKETSK